MMKRRQVTTLFAVMAVLASCSSPPSDAADGRAVVSTSPARAASGLAIVPLTIGTANGDHRFQVELAATIDEQQKGLMFRTELGPDDGMLFPSIGGPAPRSFWMKNTVIPLDMIFIAPDGTIESIAANTTPYSLEPVSSRGAVAAVLEIAGGRAAELGLAEGDAVTWETPAD